MWVSYIQLISTIFHSVCLCMFFFAIKLDWETKSLKPCWKLSAIISTAEADGCVIRFAGI